MFTERELEDMKYKRAMLITVCVIALSAILSAPANAAPNVQAAGGFSQRVLATGLGDPYEILWGPDGFLWATEKSGKKVTRIDPKTGATSTALELPEAVHTDTGQDGVLGLAFHPQLLKGTGQDYVYLSYTYDANPAGDAVEPRTKIARYTYRAENQRLDSPQDILTALPSSSDHQSARLRYGPDDKLYYTIGDQGANQLAYFCVPNYAQRLPTAGELRAQDWSAYRGKTLRLNLDGTVPNDNPMLNGVRSHIMTYGHRNAQGLDFAPNGRLYQSEQGPKTDDEINILQRGGNYGWPYVVGYRDDKAYVYANWSASSPTPCANLTFSDLEIPGSVPQQKETAWPDGMVPPVRTFGTVEPSFNFADPKCSEGGMYFICWPTIAPSSLTYYPDIRGGIPGWGNSLVMTNLKDGTVYQMALTNNGTQIGQITTLWKAQDRYRDIAISPDGLSIFVATDSAGLVRDANGAPTNQLANPGSIIEFRWQR
jgi:PQQ-dependent dehydrogenase (s-GDH family)